MRHHFRGGCTTCTTSPLVRGTACGTPFPQVSTGLYHVYRCTTRIRVLCRTERREMRRTFEPWPRESGQLRVTHSRFAWSEAGVYARTGHGIRLQSGFNDGEPFEPSGPLKVQIVTTAGVNNLNPRQAGEDLP